MAGKQANTIQEVLDILDEIISDSKEKQSPIGYFAALYRTVTEQVKKGIENHEFDNNPRMERLDVIFANRYIEAYLNYQSGKANTKSWQVAFALSEKYWPIVLQHLLVGMNAHIALDLGIAAAEVSVGKDINDLKNDFDKINGVLSSLVGEVEKDLSRIWPTLRVLLRYTRKVDNFLIDFNMEYARDKAWEFAVELSGKPQDQWPDVIRLRDEKVARFGQTIGNPGWLVNAILSVVRIGEKGSVSSRIEELAN
ncbi:MAG: hypothetical protein JJ975_09680 [Bacteroidia bacterium]|nr:hypothetical protein [Bacteroidia bacterium]